MKIRTIILVSVLLMLSLPSVAQNVRHQIRKGNKDYKKERFEQAELRYRKANEVDSSDVKGNYNLGNTLYKQEKYDEALSHYASAAMRHVDDKKQQSAVYHNIGNTLLHKGMKNREEGMQSVQQAVSAYEEALRRNPDNDDARYNLAFAKRLLQQMQQQQQQNGGNGGNDDKKDQQQNDSKQGNNKDQGQQNHQQQQSDNNQNEQQNQSQQQSGQEKQDRQQQTKQASEQAKEQKKQEAERLLEAVKNNEKQTMKEHMRLQEAGKSRSVDKDW